jgi:hypothetical protein
MVGLDTQVSYRLRTEGTVIDGSRMEATAVGVSGFVSDGGIRESTREVPGEVPAVGHDKIAS